MFLHVKLLEKILFFSDVAIGVISGLGPEGYIAALNYINQSE